jgi:nucleoside-diphosphate-sugar epimerase
VPGWFEADQMATNLAMMQNLMDPLLARAARLRHVSVLQGTKAYGAHVHRLKIPAREDSPRDPHDNFYWLQEDYIRAARAGADWRFTIWRPQVVFGGALGVAMNLIPIVAVYGAICRELGRPFVCPGVAGHVIEAVDADLIARALAWAAGSPAAEDETFNITNGDVFVWENVWPAIADALGLEPAFGEPVRPSCPSTPRSGIASSPAKGWRRRRCRSSSASRTTTPTSCSPGVRRGRCRRRWSALSSCARPGSATASTPRRCSGNGSGGSSSAVNCPGPPVAHELSPRLPRRQPR